MSNFYDAILLIAFGGPTRREEIRPFLARVTQGIPIPVARLEEVAHHYEAVGGKSPLNEITFRQANALKNLLNYRLPVYIGMRNASPFFNETLKQMAGDGVKHALGFILSSHRTEASWERYQNNIADARVELGDTAPHFDYCSGWHDHPLFIQSWAERIHGALQKTDSDGRQTPPLIFTAHSLPTAMAARSPYVDQLETSARLIADKLNHPRWSLAYQSRSGKPSDPWLEPDISQAIRDCAAHRDKEIIVAPIGFVCDHVEVLYDLDIEAKQVATDLGIKLSRVSCPNDHPTFVRMMAEVIESHVKKVADRG
jgi:ferrochelatase